MTEEELDDFVMNAELNDSVVDDIIEEWLKNDENKAWLFEQMTGLNYNEFVYGIN